MVFFCVSSSVIGAFRSLISASYRYAYVSNGVIHILCSFGSTCLLVEQTRGMEGYHINMILSTLSQPVEWNIENKDTFIANCSYID